jgi:hypothetical protein
MTLTVREQAYIIPSYSLTGDLLAYRRCGLQYRYYNRGALPPSRPVQQWFGEFIHGVMEESYRRWKVPGAADLAWDRSYIEEIEDDIVRRLAARGLRYRNRGLLEISKDRGEAAINQLGPHLFPLIAEAELPLDAVRPMQPGGRADFYEVRGIADVLTSIELASAAPDNIILGGLEDEPTCAAQLAKGRRDAAYRFEVLVDYKGMIRPDNVGTFIHDLRWQVLTYAWLRSRQPGALPVVAGVLVFINELLPTVEETRTLRRQVLATPPETDVLPTGADLDALRRWRPQQGRLLLSQPYRFHRTLMVVPVTNALVDQSLSEFDRTVHDIETSVRVETSGTPIARSWQANPVEQTCEVCDWRSFCPNTLPRFRGAPTAP